MNSIDLYEMKYYVMIECFYLIKWQVELNDQGLVMSVELCLYMDLALKWINVCKFWLIGFRIKILSEFWC